MLIDLPPGIPFTGTIAHLTLSHAEDVGPIAAKQMLDAGECGVRGRDRESIGLRMEFREW